MLTFSRYTTKFGFDKAVAQCVRTWFTLFGKLLLVGLLVCGTLTALPDSGLGTSKIFAQTVDRTVAVVGIAGAVVRDAPSGSKIATWSSGTAVVATGRTADSQWLFVQASDGTSGWSNVGSLIIFGVSKLPVGNSAGSFQGSSGAVEPSSGTAAGEQTSSSAGSQSGSTGAASSTVASSTTSSSIAGDKITVKVNTGGGGLNVRSGPGTNYGIVGSLPNKSVAMAIGRNASGSWYKLNVSSVASGSGWVFASLLDVGASDAGSKLSVVAAPAAPQVVAPRPTSVPQVVAPQPASRPQAQASPVQPLSVAISPQQAAAVQQPTAVQQSTTVQQPATASGLSGTIVFQTSLGGTFHGYELQSGRTWPITYGFDAEISPDGRRVAFVRTGGQNGLYIIDINGQNERRIFSDREWLASPKWSPDGDHLVFSRYDGRDQCQRGDNCNRKQRREYRLSVVDTNGEGYHDLATIDSARAPDWGKAGITYQSGDGIQITEDKHEAENRLVTFDYLQPQYHDPDWAPNGQKIAFMVQYSSHWQINVVNPDGSGQLAITRPLSALVDALPSNVAPAYSPDGNHIVYVSNRGADEDAGDWSIWVMNADGSGQRKLPIDMAINYTFGDEQAVSWGP